MVSQNQSTTPIPSYLSKNIVEGLANLNSIKAIVKDLVKDLQKKQQIFSRGGVSSKEFTNFMGFIIFRNIQNMRLMRNVEEQRKFMVNAFRRLFKNEVFVSELAKKIKPLDINSFYNKPWEVMDKVITSNNLASENTTRVLPAHRMIKEFIKGPSKNKDNLKEFKRIKSDDIFKHFRDLYSQISQPARSSSRSGPRSRPRPRSRSRSRSRPRSEPRPRSISRPSSRPSSSSSSSSNSTSVSNNQVPNYQTRNTIMKNKNKTKKTIQKNPINYKNHRVPKKSVKNKKKAKKIIKKPRQSSSNNNSNNEYFSAQSKPNNSNNEYF
tara:strand:+ start:191 stop:1159 length:969 start_codon:yes stop_codon:yes gene_type:complete